MTGQCQGSYYMSDHTISLKVNRVLVVFAFQMYDKAYIYIRDSADNSLLTVLNDLKIRAKL